MNINFNWPASLSQKNETKEIESKIETDISNSLDKEPHEINVFIKLNQQEQRLDGTAILPDGTQILTFTHSLVGTQISSYLSAKKS